MTNLTKDQEDKLFFYLRRIAEALESFTSIRTDSVTVDGMDEVVHHLQDLRYLHGVAEQIDELKTEEQRQHSDFKNSPVSWPVGDSEE
tara:strand:- start:680 stop:943 length:264 start_codon:yes stop_codon:yes gene_type:complete